MAALDTTSPIARAAANIAKRSNWAGHVAGVIVVFCVVFVVGSGLLSLFIYKKMVARRAAKPQK